MMKRVLIASMLVAAVVLVLVWSAPAVVSQAAGRAQRGNPAAATPSNAGNAAAIPRMPDGRPDLSGVWWGGSDVGGRNRPRGGGRGGARGAPAPSFTSLYKPEVAAQIKTLNDKDDPTLRCIPTALGTLNVRLWSVGAVGQIVATPKFVVMLTETFHSFQIIPTDRRAHREEVPPSYRGDAVGHWEGDTFVVETKNFTDDTWMFAEGRVSPHSDELRIVERYRRADANTLEIEATVYDPKVLTGPWTVPKQTLVLAPFDQIMSLNCSGIETQGLMDAAFKNPATQ